MNTELLLAYYESVGHEIFLDEVIHRTLPPEIQECFDKITGCVKLHYYLDDFPAIFITQID